MNQPHQTEAEAPVVQVRNLWKVFPHGGADVVALDDVSLDIDYGELVALMGPSGSGKSTLLHIIAGIDRATRGECRVLGHEIGAMSENQLSIWRNHHIGFVFQSFNLIPVLTAYHNVEIPLLLTRLSKKERREHILTVLDIVGLSDRITHYPRQLSGGQEQRVAIARALVTDPDLLLADEPTGELDTHSAEEVMKVLQKLNRDFGKTIIMVTHDPKACAYATITRHLDKGTILPV